MLLIHNAYKHVSVSWNPSGVAFHIIMNVIKIGKSRSTITRKNIYDAATGTITDQVRLTSNPSSKSCDHIPSHSTNCNQLIMLTAGLERFRELQTVGWMYFPPTLENNLPHASGTYKHYRVHSYRNLNQNTLQIVTTYLNTKISH